MKVSERTSASVDVAGEDNLFDQLSALSPGQREQVLEWIRQTDQAQVTYPLAPKQLGIWFLDRLVPGTPLYSVPWMCRIRGNLDP